MTSVSNQITAVLRRVGGYVNHPHDKGGPTNHGITQAALSSYLGRPATVEEVRSMTEATAREIYERNYWTGPRIHTLPKLVQPVVFDGAVNHGPRNAVRMLQGVINEAGFGPMSRDGVIGPQTRSAAKRAASEMGPWLVNAYVEARRQLYHRLVAGDPKQGAFLRGWLARIEEFEMEVA